MIADVIRVSMPLAELLIIMAVSAAVGAVAAFLVRHH